jgi:hypothetical protein
MTAEKPEGLDTELVPDLTTELADAAAAQDDAAETAAPADAGGVRPARRYAVYDTRLERYVGGLVTFEDAEAATSKTGRFRLHEPGTDGRLVSVSRP